jgi:hypothetical protein
MDECKPLAVGRRRAVHAADAALPSDDRRTAGGFAPGQGLSLTRHSFPLSLTWAVASLKSLQPLKLFTIKLNITKVCLS